ncbi:alanine--glyoxylate aminotransferase 2 homolog 1, mitochondrial, partial [Tanacetum coccineum]
MHGAKNADYGVNILTNSNFCDGTNGWFPPGNYRMGVVKNGSPHLVPHAARNTLSGHCIHATNRSYTWMGPAQIMTDKVKLCHVLEANELAMLMTRLYSGNLGIIALRNAYHGGSATTIGLTALNTWNEKVGGSGGLGNKSEQDVQDHIDYSTSGRVVGVGGAVELAPGYLKLVYDMVRKAGGVCIADEVQTGFGRTGSHYWGFQKQDVVPDIVTMPKVAFHDSLIPLDQSIY